MADIAVVHALVAAALLACAVLVAPSRQGLGAKGLGGENPVENPAEGLHPAGDVRAAGAPRHDPGVGAVAASLALLALGYRSGLATWRVLEAVAESLDGTAGDAFADAAADLRQVAAALRWGASDGEAWNAVGPAWVAASRAIQVAHAAGIPPGPVLLAAADDLRRAEVESLELAAAKVGVRLVAPLGLVLLPAFCLTTVVPLVLALARQLLAT